MLRCRSGSRSDGRGENGSVDKLQEGLKLILKKMFVFEKMKLSIGISVLQNASPFIGGHKHWGEKIKQKKTYPTSITFTVTTTHSCHHIGRMLSTGFL